MGILISDRISYRNHYMCSGEATSIDKNEIEIVKKTSLVCVCYNDLFSLRKQS